MSSEVKAKRRKNKKSSPALKFVSRFRIAQPGAEQPMTQHVEAPSTSAGPAKFFHWKYDDIDTSVQDDGTAPPVYGRRAPLGKTESSAHHPALHHIMDQAGSSSKHSGHARQWLQDMQPEDIMRRQMEAQEMQMRSQQFMYAQHAPQVPFPTYGTANPTLQTKADLFAYKFQGISPHSPSQHNNGNNNLSPLLQALSEDEAMDVDQAPPPVTESGRRTSLALQHVLSPTTDHSLGKMDQFHSIQQHPSGAERSVMIGHSEHSAFKPAQRRNQANLFFKNETMLSSGGM